MTLKIKYKHTDMKQIWLYTICLGLVGLFACQQEDLPSVGDTGFLSLENMTVEVANTESISTRAGDNDLYVEISSQDMTPEVTLKYNPGDSIPDKIELGTGRYALKIYNDTTLLDEIPVFYKDTIFDIEAGKVNYLSVEVPMINIGVQLVLPEGFSSDSGWFEDYTFTVRVGKAGEEKTVELKDEEIVYFSYSSDVKLSYQLIATNKDGERFESEEITYDKLLSPGTIYVITYDYATKALRLLEP